ncbi:MAG: GIY-YIG nuclease family protein [Gammaproteobacteria bacterium]|nr:GIY-YIG nuclease family protein [Gammaproteobacteria bacterium]
MSATTLELFFIDGQPEGMLTAEVFGWTGHILVTPRTRLPAALKRKESGYTGVYILLGEQGEQPLAYIGEGENIANRIKSHDAQKDWWTKAVLITSAANNLHKAHVQYLESSLVKQATKAANMALENGTTPSLPGLSEAAQANMEAFIKQLLMVLPALRVDLFRNNVKANLPQENAVLQPEKEIPIFELTLKKEGITATAILNGSDFIVQKGSLAKGTYTGGRSVKAHYWKQYDKLVEQGILRDQGKHKVFTQDYAFSSTSAAGAVCNGRSTAGPTAWKVQGTGQTYKEWEAALLAET